MPVPLPDHPPYALLTAAISVRYVLQALLQHYRQKHGEAPPFATLNRLAVTVDAHLTCDLQTALLEGLSDPPPVHPHLEAWMGLATVLSAFLLTSPDDPDAAGHLAWLRAEVHGHADASAAR